MSTADSWKQEHDSLRDATQELAKQIADLQSVSDVLQRQIRRATLQIQIGNLETRLHVHKNNATILATIQGNNSIPQQDLSEMETRLRKLRAELDALPSSESSSKRWWHRLMFWRR